VPALENGKFYQWLIIQAEIDYNYEESQNFDALAHPEVEYGHCLPIFGVLMTSKEQKLYEKIFEKVRELLSSFEPSNFMSDFETGLQNSLQNIWPQCTINGCCFHFKSAIAKWIRKSPIFYEYRTNTNVKKWIRKVSSLCFLPADKIPFQWNKLCAELLRFAEPTKSKLLKFKLYFGSFWMKKVGPSRFSVFKLNHKTNNYMESLNSRLNKGFKANHQGFWKSVDLYKKLAIDWTLRELNGIENSRIVKRDRRNYDQIEKIKLHEQKLENGEWSVDHFLRVSSHLFDEIPIPDEAQGVDLEDDVQETLETEILQELVSKCIICDMHPRNTAIMPCRHMYFCFECIESVKRSNTPHCPTCRGEITEAIPFFV